MAKKQKQSSGGNRKHGRSVRTPIRKMKHAQQPARTIKNKKRKLKKHLSLQPKDRQALAALKKML